MTLQEKIREIYKDNGISQLMDSTNTTRRIINEIIKPLTESAFEAGWKCKVNNGYKVDGTYYQDLEQWQKENLK